MSSPLANLLFKDYRRRVLCLLLLHADRSYHVREIARLTNTVAGTLHKELTRLEEAGLLVKRAVGNQRLYSANTACPIFAELAGILRKTVGVVDVLAEALAPLLHSIDTAFVYGSVARGTETIGSDIDVLLIGEVEFAQVVKALHPCEQQLGREINAKIYHNKEWQKMEKGKDAFVQEVMAQPKLYIIGGGREPEQ